jgi:hypothetical protein
MEWDERPQFGEFYGHRAVVPSGGLYVTEEFGSPGWTRTCNISVNCVIQTGVTGNTVRVYAPPPLWPIP